jgi:hypothetical protein
MRVEMIKSKSSRSDGGGEAEEEDGQKR